MLDLATYFARAYVINLDDDVQRLADFRQRTGPDCWPLAQPQRWRAVSGKKAPHPQWWRGGDGAWGCFRSHLQIVEQCLMDDVPSVLILEDDAVPCDDFARRVRSFLEAVPKDWGMIYLGGQHLLASSHPPKPVVVGRGPVDGSTIPPVDVPGTTAPGGVRNRPPTTDHHPPVFRPYNVNRTHAFALSREGMKVVYQHLCRQDWIAAQHIDHHLGRLHMHGGAAVYCPKEWLIGQAPGMSRISGRTPGMRFWKDAAELAGKVQTQEQAQEQSPFVAIIGLHSSGSSAVAGVCWHLGLHLGNALGGYYQADANHPGQRGFEAQGLAKICERAARFPAIGINNAKTLHNELARWIGERQREAKNRNTLAAGKYPHLCRMGEQLQAICGDGLYVIHCDRPLEESIESLKRRVQRGSPKCSPSQAEAVQRWLYEGKRQLLVDVPAQRQITIPYDALLESPETQIKRIVAFLELAATPEQIAAAASLVRPDQRHIYRAR